MRAICYVSQASRELQDADLQHLLEAARARNREHAITGLLLFCEGSFMQYFEGPREHVATIWEIIRADDKHRGIVTLFDRSVPERLYADWTMAYHATSPPDFAALLASVWSTDREGTPQECWFVPGVRLLREFWENNQAGRFGLRGVVAG